MAGEKTMHTNKVVAPSLFASLVDVELRSRIARHLALLLALAWAVCAWRVLRPEEISSDWHGWRQTDTQTIALNFMKPDARILSPQINWGGDGPGYVESEFQLYTRVLALLMQLGGPGEWLGQLVSLLAVTATALLIFLHLSRSHPPVAALLGFGAFLAARTSPHLATVVMPDALALLAYTLGWTLFTRYADSGRSAYLVGYGVLGLLAMLIKPTTAHLGVSSFVLLLLSQRERLREPRLWLTWLAMVAGLGAYLAHAHTLYTDYGNTFGLLIGEDSKLPGLAHLLMPRPYLAAARFGITWALGGVALVALLVQLLRRHLRPELVALAVGNALIVLIALRYMSDGAGVHYFAPATLLGACAVASVSQDALRTRYRSLVLGALALLIAGEGYRSIRIRYFHAHFYGDALSASIIATGKELDQHTQPGDLVVVRSPNPAYDRFWQRSANYHDPRIFYLSGTRGWTLGSEQEDVGLLEDAVRRGARFFADPLAQRSAPLEAWLSVHAELVWGGANGRIWRLHVPDEREASGAGTSRGAESLACATAETLSSSY
jgi:hypothetical protein